MSLYLKCVCVLISHQRALELATKVSFPVGETGEGGHTR